MIAVSIIFFILSGRTIYYVRKAVRDTKWKTQNTPEDNHHGVHRYQLGVLSPLPSPLQVPATTGLRNETLSQDGSEATHLPLPQLYLKPSLSATPSDDTDAALRQSPSSSNTTTRRRTSSKTDSAIWGYSKFALLYALVLIITWVWSIVNT
jgi:hypothetical protein